MLRISKIALVSMSIAIYSAPAFAHPGHGIDNTVVQGFLHPVSGVDHALAMLSVGFLAFRLGGRALWAIPAAFIIMMAAGGVLGATGPTIEQVIATSVLVLGVLMALAARLSLPFVIPVTALFAMFHGVALGTEGAVGSALPLSYFSGFLLATAVLLGAGIVLGHGVSVLQKRDLLQRIAGAAVGLTGFLMLVG